MDINSFLFPREQFALVIWYIQIGFFLFWFLLIVREAIKLKRFEKQIKEFEDITKLKNFLRSPSKSLLFEMQGYEEFNTFCSSISKHNKSPIVKHLRAIFQSGLKESSLDINLLIKSTNNRLLSANTTLRSMLSLFIILGLLGTLGGLSLSLNELSGLLTVNTQISNESLSLALKNLLPKLGVAFATSFWGVVFTILGVLIFGLYYNLIIMPISRLLEGETLTNWVPNLIPTPSQILHEKLILTEHQMQKSFDAAQKVGEFANDIKNDAGALSQSFRNTHLTLETLKTATENLNEFSKTFIESVGKLAPFQDDLRNLYQHMANDSQKFNKTIEYVLISNREFHENVEREFKFQASQTEKFYNAHSEQSTNLLKALRSYEDAYLKNRESVDANLLVLMQNAQQAFQSISTQNEAIVYGLAKAVGDPIREDLVTGLTGISSQTQEGFTGISTKLDTALGEKLGNVAVELFDVADILKHINIPLKAAAEKIELTFETFDKHTEVWANKVNSSLVTQNDNGKTQVETLNYLNENVSTLITKITDLSTVSEELRSLNSTINALQVNIEKIKSNGNQSDGGKSSERAIQKPTRWKRIKNKIGL